MKNPARISNLFAYLMVSALGLSACGGGDSSADAVTLSTAAANLGMPLLGGTTVPADTLGKNGDFYLDVTTGRLYGPKAADAWPGSSLLLLGQAGPVGAPGNTLLNGTANPSASQGNNGDFYLNTATNSVFGPKAAGAWPATGVSIVGPIGATGAAGVNGATGAAGANGTNGTNGTNGAVGATGANGATGAAGTNGIQRAKVLMALSALLEPMEQQALQAPMAPPALSALQEPLAPRETL